MRLFIPLIFLLLVACPGSDLHSASSKKGRRNTQIPIGKRTRPVVNPETGQANTQQTPEGNPFIFPIQISGDDVGMEVFTAGGNTRLIIQTVPEIQSLNILAGFDGQFSSENPRKITLTSSRRELVFHLTADISLADLAGTTVTQGQVLGSTTGSVTLTLKENGTPSYFCLLQESEEQIRVRIISNERGCDTP